MAINQYDFFAVPRSTFVEKGAVVTNFKELKLINDEILWQPLSINPEMFFVIAEMLPLSKSWHPNLLIFGDIDSNCLEMSSFKGGVVDSVTFRIDVLSNYEPVLRYLIAFFNEHDIMVLDKDFSPVDTTFDACDTCIKESWAYKAFKR